MRARSGVALADPGGVRCALAILPALLAACEAPEDAGAPVVLPAPTVIAEEPDWISAIAVDDRHVYWTAGPGDWASRTGRVRRVAREGGEPETLAAGRTGVAALIVGARRVYWIDGGGKDGASLVLAVDKDAPGEPLDLTPTDLGHSDYVLIGETDDRLRAATADGWQDVYFIANPETLEHWTVCNLPDWRVHDTLSDGHETWFLVDGDYGGAVVRVETEAHSCWDHARVTGIRRPIGFSRVGDDIYWLDGNYPDRTREIRRLSIPGGSGGLVAETALELGEPAWVGGLGWAPVSATPPGTLARIDPAAGAVATVAVEYPVRSVLADGDSLLVVACDDGGCQLLRQPLP